MTDQLLEALPRDRWLADFEHVRGWLFRCTQMLHAERPEAPR
jgi:hypothetical protein